MSRNYKQTKKNGQGSYGKDPKGKSNNKSRGGKRDKDDNFDQAKLDSTGRDNDPGYYFTSPELAKQAAQLSFQTILGGTNPYNATDSTGHNNVPGVVRIDLNPSMGNYFGIDTPNRDLDVERYDQYPKLYTSVNDALTKAPINGANLMLTKMYTLLSTYSGRTTNYLPSDIGMMIGAITSFSELSEHVRRVIGLGTVYNPRNRFMPKGIIRAMDVDPDDLMSNIAAYRMRFNTIVSRMNQIPLLDNIAFIRKGREIFQKVYTDSSSSLAQYIVMCPYSVWILNETKYPTGSCLEPTLLHTGTGSGTVKPLSDLLDIMEEQAEALLSSSTLQIVYADLMHLASKISVPMWHFDYLAENYVVIPEFNENFLLQFHNMTIMGAPMSSITPDAQKGYYDASHAFGSITYHMPVTKGNEVISIPETGWVFQNPIMSSKVPYNFGLIDFTVSEPNEVDIIESMRFTSICGGYLTDDGAYVFNTMADHYVVQMRFYDNPNSNGSIGKTSNIVGSNGTGATTLINADEVDYITKFDYHPLLYRSSSASANLQHITGSVGDLNFYTNVDFQYLTRVNKLMFEGLFDFRPGSSK